MERAAYVFDSDGRIFAVTMDGDTVDYAIEVVEPRLDCLAEDATEAVLQGDVDLANWVTERIAYRRAQVISAYIEVNV